MGRPFPSLLIATVQLISALLGTATCVAAGDDDPFRDFDAYAAAALTDWQTPAMAVAVVRDGQVIFARGFGRRNAAGQDTVDADTVFPIASITKAFNATALAILVDEGKLSWTDPVVRHLPDFELHDPYLTREVRIADLLCHRTGLEDPDLLTSGGAITRRELLARTRFLRQIAPFRTSYRYNNLGPIIAGEILERVSSQSWSNFVRSQVLEPLKMTATVPNVLELDGRTNIVTTYVTVGGELQEDKSWNLPLSEGWRRYRETIRPSGAICSTANDLAKFLQFQLAEGEFDGRRLVKAETLRDMQALHNSVPITPPMDSKLPLARLFYGSGLGWLTRDYRGRKLVMHDGSTGTVIAFMPEERLGVVVLTNLGCGIQFMVMHDVFDRVLRIPRTWSNRDWICATVEKDAALARAADRRLRQEQDKKTPPRFELREYAGVYQSELYGQLVVTVKDDGLCFELGPNCHAPLTHYAGEQFRATFVLRFAEDWLLSFAEQDGRVSTATITRVDPRGDVATFRRVNE